MGRSMSETVEVSTKQVIVIRKDLNMRKGKMAAQAAHASLGVFTQHMQIHGAGDLFIGTMAFGGYAKQWLDSSFRKICVGCDSQGELLAILREAEVAGIPCILITDNGDTEFNGTPTDTCIAIGPWKSSDIDRITGHLKLL
jgi:PTH2 family peptidyl-tRNA hydrolase